MQTDDAPAPGQAGVAPPGSVVGAAEASDLLQLGDVVLGVTGVCTLGMDPTVLSRAIAAAASVTPCGVVVLHVSRVPVDFGLVDELAAQMALAAAELLGSREVVEDVQAAVYASVVLAAGGGSLGDGDDDDDGGGGGGGGSSSSLSTAPWGSRSVDTGSSLPAGGHAGVLSDGAAPHLLAVGGNRPLLHDC